MSNLTNLDNLQNIQPLQLNTTMFENIDNPVSLVTAVFDTVTAATGDLWFIVSILCIFVFMNWLFFRREENFGYDIGRTLLISSGFCFFIAVAFLLSGWISTIYPVIWFSTLIFISFLAVKTLKEKGG